MSQDYDEEEALSSDDRLDRAYDRMGERDRLSPEGWVAVCALLVVVVAGGALAVLMVLP